MALRRNHQSPLAISVRRRSGCHRHTDRGTLTNAYQDKHAKPNQPAANAATGQSNQPLGDRNTT